MNSQIEAWRVQAYAANVYHTAQQKGARLASLVRNEKFKGKAEFFDRLAQATAQRKTGRNSDTPNLDITHSRRMVTTNMYEWATLVDRKDKLQNIHSPESEYAIAARNALGRSIDDVIIDAALGTARTGEDGSSSTSLGTAQKVVPVSGAAQQKMTVSALRKAKYLLDAAEAEGKRYFVHDAAALENMLGQTEVTSHDYNTVRALVAGEIDTFLGFKFIRSERVLDSSTYSSGFTFNTSTGLYDAAGSAINASSVSNFCFVGDGIILGMNEDMVARIGERDDKSYDMQVYASMDFGAVRMEEVKVVEIICLP